MTTPHTWESEGVKGRCEALGCHEAACWRLRWRGVAICEMYCAACAQLVSCELGLTPPPPKQ
jgi:hypothetical protein